MRARQALLSLLCFMLHLSHSTTFEFDGKVIHPKVELHSGFSSSKLENATLYDYFEDIRFPLPTLIPYKPVPAANCDTEQYPLCLDLRHLREVIQDIDFYQRQLERLFLSKDIWGKLEDMMEDGLIEFHGDQRIHLCTNIVCKQGFQQAQEAMAMIHKKTLSVSASDETVVVMTELTSLADHLEYQMRFRNAIFKYYRALRACSKSKVPATAVKPGVLRRYLKKINRDLEDEGMKLAISLELLSEYYELGLARCDFWTGDDEQVNGVVTVHLPVVRQQSNYELRVIYPIKFGARGAGICEIESVHEQVFFETNTHEVLFMERIDMLQCLERRLCQLSKATNKSVVANEALCISERLGGFPDGLQFDGGVSIWSPPESTVCSIRCTDSDPNSVEWNALASEVYLTNFGDDVIVRTGDGQLMSLKGTVEVGTTLIVLPCEWALFVGEMVFAGYPGTCAGKAFSVKGLLPEVMFLESGVQ